MWIGDEVWSIVGAVSTEWDFIWLNKDSDLKIITITQETWSSTSWYDQVNGKEKMTLIIRDARRWIGIYSEQWCNCWKKGKEIKQEQLLILSLHV